MFSTMKQCNFFKTALVYLNVEVLYANWQNIQKKTVHLPIVKKYVEILPKAIFEPIILGAVVYDDDDSGVCIRTSDGRHRLAAAHSAGLKTIPVYIAEKMQQELKTFFPGIFATVEKESTNESSTNPSSTPSLVRK